MVPLQSMLQLTINARLARRGKGVRLVIEGASHGETDPGLVKLLRRIICAAGSTPVWPRRQHRNHVQAPRPVERPHHVPHPPVLACTGYRQKHPRWQSAGCARRHKAAGDEQGPAARLDAAAPDAWASNRPKSPPPVKKLYIRHDGNGATETKASRRPEIDGKASHQNHRKAPVLTSRGNDETIAGVTVETREMAELVDWLAGQQGFEPRFASPVSL